MRLGCGMQVIGVPGLHSYDGRRGHNAPHLSVSLVHLRAVLTYLHSVEIKMYRMSPDLAPYATHPDYPELHHQIDDCTVELAELGRWVKVHDFRLSFHAPSTVALATADPRVALATQQQLGVLTGLLDGLDADPEAVIVVHVGGMVGGEDAAVSRWVQNWESLAPRVRARLALEHDDKVASLGVAFRIHAATGVPVVFDHLHWLLHNPEGYALREALELTLLTWPIDVRPKLHFASPRTELRATLKTDAPAGERTRTNARRRRWVLGPPRPGHHSDFVHPWEFARFAEAARGLRDFDVLLEAKASDVALLRLRHDLARYVPTVSQWLAASVDPQRASEHCP